MLSTLRKYLDVVTGATVPRIFISYRRAESHAIADSIQRRLAEVFGNENVFEDTIGIQAGADFRKVLHEQVSTCDVLLVIIGQEWLRVADEAGKRRLDNPDDFVRIEVETGLKHPDTLVIPVLVNNARMPRADDDLPGSLRELAYRNAVEVRNNPYFTDDMARLIRQLRKRRISCRLVILGALAVAMMAVVGFVMIVAASSRQQSVDAVAMALTDTAEVQIALILTGFADSTDEARTAVAVSWTDTPAVTALPSNTSTAPPTFTLTATPTPTEDFLATAGAQATIRARDANGTQAALNAQATADAQETLNVPTNTSEPTAIPTERPSNTPLPTTTASSTATATSTNSPTVSATPSETLTPTEDLTATAKVRATADAQAVQDAQATFAIRQTQTQAAKDTHTATATPTSTPSTTLTMTATSSYTPTATFAATAQPVGIITVNSNIRSGPGTGNPVVTVVSPGEQLAVLEIVEGGAWVHVRVNDNIDGYISSQLIQTLTPTLDPLFTPPTPTASPVRPTASPRQQWIQTGVVTANNCDSAAYIAYAGQSNSLLTFSNDRNTLIYNPRWQNQNFSLSRVSENVYRGVFDNNQLTITITFTSSRTSKISWVQVYGDPNNGGCTYTINYDGRLLG